MSHEPTAPRSFFASRRRFRISALVHAGLLVATAALEIVAASWALPIPHALVLGPSLFAVGWGAWLLAWGAWWWCALHHPLVRLGAGVIAYRPRIAPWRLERVALAEIVLVATSRRSLRLTTSTGRVTIPTGAIEPSEAALLSRVLGDSCPR